MNIENMTLTELCDWINDNLGHRYSAGRGGRFAYITDNSGQWHQGDMEGCAGFDRFKGFFTKQELIQWIHWIK